MKRRDFSVWAASGLVGAGSLTGAPSVQAQAGVPPEGSFVKLSQRLPPSSSGKIEVVEFFWYGCPHCNHFEPFLEPWAAKLPADVYFHRIPVVFRENPFVIHQRLYYALEALGQVNAMQRKVFHAIHDEQKHLDTEQAIVDFVASQGIDRAKFLDAFNSFSVQSKGRQARQLAEAYKIDGVPALGIAGRYFTSVSLAGSPEKALSVADALIAQARKGG